MVENATVAPSLLVAADGGKRSRTLASIAVKKEKRNNGREGGMIVAYLNNAGQARLSAGARLAGISCISSSAGAGCANPKEAEDDLRRVRELYGAVIGSPAGDGSDVAVHPSTAFAVTMAAENVYSDFVEKLEGKGKLQDARGPHHILILEDQMNSAVYPWQNVCNKSNGRLKLLVVPYPAANNINENDDDGDGESGCGGDQSWTDAVLSLLQGGGGSGGNANNSNNVVAACLPPLHWSDGTTLDLVRIGRACRDLGIPLVVDSTQATGIYPCSVAEIRPAMMACSVHKWLRGPSGMSLVYVDPALHSRWAPLDQHGRGRDFGPEGKEWDAGRHDMAPDGHYEEKFYDDARKFDAGGKPNGILLPMLRAALEEVARIDVDDAQRHLRSIVTPLIDWARNRGDFDVSPPPPSSPAEGQQPPYAYHLVGIRPKRVTPHRMVEIANRLEREEGIYVAVRCGAFRVSPYLDNSREDIDRLIDALSRML